MDGRAYQALKLATVAMGVMILAGVALLAIGLSHRAAPAVASAAAAGVLTWAEPPGSRIIGIASAGAAIAVALTGGGPDRVLLVDPVTLAPRAEARLPTLPAAAPRH